MAVVVSMAVVMVVKADGYLLDKQQLLLGVFHTVDDDGARDGGQAVNLHRVKGQIGDGVTVVSLGDGQL